MPHQRRGKSADAEAGPEKNCNDPVGNHRESTPCGDPLPIWQRDYSLERLRTPAQQRIEPVSAFLQSANEFSRQRPELIIRDPLSNRRREINGCDCSDDPSERVSESKCDRACKYVGTGCGKKWNEPQH